MMYFHRAKLIRSRRRWHLIDGRNISDKRSQRIKSNSVLHRCLGRFQQIGEEAMSLQCQFISADRRGWWLQNSTLLPA